MTIYCQAPNPNPTDPIFTVPAGATDCHFHLFGPEMKYPYVAERGYTPPDASIADYRLLAETLGIERAVLVQASVYGQDNQKLLDALPQLGMPARGVAVTSPNVSDRELDKMHDRGVRAIRVISVMPGGIPMQALPEIAKRLASRGWHIQLVLNPDHLLEHEKMIASLPCQVMIDHNAFIPAKGGIGHPAFQALLRMMTRDHLWTKLTASYHCASQPPYSDLDSFAEALIDAAPDRTVWGTDWPHVNVEGEMPNTTVLLDRVKRWLPDPTGRARLLVDNPAELYGF